MASNGSVPVKSSAEIEIDASPQVVWEVLTRFENWPSWNPDVKSMSFDGPLAPGSEFRWKAGPGTIVSTLDRIEPPLHIAWRGRTLTINAYHEWWLEPSDGGTHARTEESFSGLLVRLLRGSLQKTLDKSLRDGLEHLKHEAERRST
ncbi:MAG: polyketide cyclase [Actinobacteria bacterium]|nr:MAG: polyketide cyclase [Actinomycetota bacterium]